MTAFEFNSRESYFAARAEWRAAYKAITIASRMAKKEFVEAQREYSAGKVGSTPVEKARGNRWTIKQEAKKLLDIRQKMKEEAQRQWNAEKMIA